MAEPRDGGPAAGSVPAGTSAVGRDAAEPAPAVPSPGALVAPDVSPTPTAARDVAPAAPRPAADDPLTVAAWGAGGSSGSLTVAPLTTLVVGLVCGGVAAARVGDRGAVSALIGTALVALFFWSGLLPILLSRGQEDRAAMGLAVLLVNYTLRLALALLLLRGAERADLVDTRVLGVTIIIATLTWTGTQVALLARRPGGV